jgi:hypothetical protein
VIVSGIVEVLVDGTARGDDTLDWDGDGEGGHIVVAGAFGVEMKLWLVVVSGG